MSPLLTMPPRNDKVISLDPASVQFDFTGVADLSRYDVKEFVHSAGDLFVANVQALCGGNCSDTSETSVTVHVATSSGDLTLNWLTDESYSLEVNTRDNRVDVHIQAETVYGARHGLETLTQLTAATDTDDLYGYQLVIVTTAKVSDKPKHPHRGLLLDSARNYLPLRTILRTIDAMASCKLNVFHWHITDSHSFPIYMPTLFMLAKYGAYSETEVYTMEDIKAVVDYARVRGVRMIMELDMPAHAGNGWQWAPAAAQGNITVCVNKEPWNQYCLQPPCGQLNPANRYLYGVLGKLFQELLEVLPPGEAIHMGGDEVYFPCWNQTQEITDWMLSRGLDLSESSFLQIWGEFHKKVLDQWDLEIGHKKTPVLLWTSHLTNINIIERYLDKDRFVIESWTDSMDPLPTQLMDKGYRVIMATRDAWYLDHGFWGRTQYHSWRRAYDNRLPQGRNMLGGEVAMWGELVDDHNLDAKVWPRATAAAERLWSDPTTTNRLAEDRLVEQRDRLVKRGLQPEAIQPRWCAQNQGGCYGSANNS
ncbi:chitooligosaccharidolytic beta-N-acetylglucosaminidase-like [Homalodisca vitripennis]|uniref:chitooligosaccharidolytic beta-N-acetylglucosaminidase-like n=1 Tax=Homalodisca vitripennis TaxID=197043 RepID=UPI001EEB2251|nr:chitooligosaccharidolytic beta-N-acetylglucosaminidase-like [Homalodisca vitripennis]